MNRYEGSRIIVQEEVVVHRFEIESLGEFS